MSQLEIEKDLTAGQNSIILKKRPAPSTIFLKITLSKLFQGIHHTSGNQLHPVFQNIIQLIHIQRFREMSIHACIFGQLYVFCKRIGSHGNNRQLALFTWKASDCCGCLITMIARTLYQSYFIHSLSTLYYYNAPSLATRFTGDYRDRTYTGKCGPALLDTRKRKAMACAMTCQFIFAVLFSRNTCQFYIYVIISYRT